MNKEDVFIQRISFFNDIIHILKRNLCELDTIFQQNTYLVPLNENNFFTDPINGELICKYKHQFFNQEFEMLYSVWQIGNMLKIGFLIRDETIYQAFAENHFESIDIWHGNGHLNIQERHGIFYDWTFQANELYQSYLNQETYIMGIRHMHINILRIIYQFLEKNQKQEINISFDDL